MPHRLRIALTLAVAIIGVLPLITLTSLAGRRPLAGAFSDPSPCLQWDIRGVWQTQQGNGYKPVMTFSQSGTALSGSAVLTPAEAASAGYTGTHGSITGTLIGDKLDIVVTWPPRANGSVPRGRYTGTVSQGQIAGAATSLETPAAAAVTWSGTGPAGCVDAIGGSGPGAGTPGMSTLPGEGERAALRLYYHAGRADYLSTATTHGAQDAQSQGYVFLGIQGQISTVQRAGMVPLKLYFGTARGDFFSTCTSTGESNALAAGYTLVRTEGYVYPSQQPGTIPLRLWYHDGLGDNFTTASDAEDGRASAAGYRYVRIECYIWPAGTPVQTPQPTPIHSPTPQATASPSPPPIATPAPSPTPTPDFDAGRPVLPPRLGTELGPVDLARFCRDNASEPVPPETASGQWWCAASEDDYWAADPAYACRQTYKDPIAVARQRDPNDSNSWVCYHGDAPPPPKPSAPGWPDPYRF